MIVELYEDIVKNNGGRKLVEIGGFYSTFADIQNRG